ncbi:MAG: AAA-like domain-containing protein, partial [Cyanobacteria bacterium J06592_8]
MSNGRSLNVSPEQLERVKTALQRNSFPSKQALATELGKSKSTIDNFFNGKRIDRLNFQEICEKLGLDWQSVAEIADEEATLYVKRSPVEAKCVESVGLLGCLIRIKASERMGKTSLINWLLKQSQQRGYHTVYWNLLQPREAVTQDLDQL